MFDQTILSNVTVVLLPLEVFYILCWYVLMNGKNNAQQLSAPPDNIQYQKLEVH